MDTKHAVALLFGIAIAGRSVWQHLGRTPAARRWAQPNQPWFQARKVLVVWPLIAAVLVLTGLTGALAPWRAATMAVAAVAALCAFTLFAFLVLPIPVPRWAKPGWYRRYGDSRE